MASERTPLFQTVRVGPPRRRYPHDTCRRFFTIASTCMLLWGFATFAAHVFLIWPHHYHHGHHDHHSASYSKGKRLNFDQLEGILLDTPSPELSRQWLEYYTSGPHLAGKNKSQAEWTRDRWEEWGVKSSLATYDVYINYPEDHKLTLLEQKKKSESWDVIFEASLTEDVLEDDPSTGLEDRIPTFHGYSASGNVTAPVVWVNYGTYQDFQDLVDAGIDLEGKIALVKYGTIFRGLKVKRAQELGMIGVLIYSDPGDDGEITEENGYEAYPNGPARNPSSVQRGSVQYLSTRPGDPTTPGYPSKPGVPRTPPDSSTPSIPSLPISYADALPILKALNGHGPKATEFNKWWNRNNGLRYKGVEYNIGPTPDHIVVNLYNQQEYTTTPQWDVIGIINGTIPNEVIVIGNHRDAWIAGGGADPNSGSATLNEVVRSVGKALDAGWKPLRTIVFASWDGEEYGLVGSTEWVEEYLPWIQDSNVAYINLDVAVRGPYLTAGATPSLNQVLRNAVNRVQSPDQSTPGQTVGDTWSGRISTMGSGSDFTAFQDYAGVPCLNLGFVGSSESSVYHYHSNFDSFHWMEKYGDPGFKYHVAMAQIFGLLIAELSESIILPFNNIEYTHELEKYIDKVEAQLDAADETSQPETEEEITALRASTFSQNKEVRGSADALRESLVSAREALREVRYRADELRHLENWANDQMRHGIPWWNIVKQIQVGRAILKVNQKYKLLERDFLFEGGLDGRDWFKHVIYAPGLWTGYSGAVYPGLTESIDAKDYMNGLKWAKIITKCFRKAAKNLA